MVPVPPAVKQTTIYFANMKYVQCVFRVILRTNSDFFPKEHQLAGHAMDVQNVLYEPRIKFLGILKS
jgi:hypothetical protein